MTAQKNEPERAGDKIDDKMADRLSGRKCACDACGVYVERMNMEMAFGNMLLCPCCAEQLLGDS